MAVQKNAYRQNFTLITIFLVFISITFVVAFLYLITLPPSMLKMSLLQKR
jgi:two-component system phosphate regulon sensor histidine kinase PhoR